MSHVPRAIARSEEINGVRWVYTDRGAGPVVLFLHGMLASAAMFEGLVTSLADRYRCVAVDWPGHGRSGFDPSGWTCDDLLNGMMQIIDRLRVSTVSLVGLSQGGAVSLRAALRHPDRVDALVLMGAGAGEAPADLAAEFTRLGQLLGSSSPAERREILRGVQLRLHRPGWVDAEPEAACQELLEMSAHDPRALPLLTRVPSSIVSVEDDLPTLGCPTLVLWGAEDPHVSVAHTMADTIPDVRAVIVPGAGHHITHDAPETCAHEVGGFLDRLHRRVAAAG